MTDAAHTDQPKSSADIHLFVGGAGPVDVKALPGGTAVLTVGTWSARAAIFFPDLQTLWAALVEAERQTAHLGTEPAVDPTVVGNGSPS